MCHCVTVTRDNRKCYRSGSTLPLSLSRLDWRVQEASPVIPSLHRQRGAAPSNELDEEPSEGATDRAEEEGDEETDGLHHGLVQGAPVQGGQVGLDVRSTQINKQEKRILSIPLCLFSIVDLPT